MFIEDAIMENSTEIKSRLDGFTMINIFSLTMTAKTIETFGLLKVNRLGWLI